MQAYYASYNDLLAENLPHVHKHFVTSHLTPDLYLLDWIYTVFTKAMNLDLASRVWDVFLRDGEEFLFRAALGGYCVLIIMIRGAFRLTLELFKSPIYLYYHSIIYLLVKSQVQ